ncbi:unnamed protein product [Callosobruchus maculatus]|uniref:WD repeat-containing protein 55 homolog n=1 Tax=Callosobruchus maculatus TaxID=64391 RepID=A0A653BKG5_CALMS|nr:unnamed protein product [Callosobruchus maculatus]
MNAYIIQMEENDLSSTSSDSGSESDTDQDINIIHYRSILQGLINRCRTFFSGDIMPPVVDESLERRRLPKIPIKPDTAALDVSEFALMTKQSSGDLPTKVDYGRNNIIDLLSNREKGVYFNNNLSYAKKCKINNLYVPNEMSIMDGCRTKYFCGIFSRDGNRLITASQDQVIRVYDSSTVPYVSLHKIRARDVGWSIIDIAFSPNNEQFVYTTWSSALHLCSVNDKNGIQEPLSLIKNDRRFCVFAATFSSDGKEVLGGASDGCLYIYNLQERRRTLKIAAHAYDVNSVCFADDSSHIIYSGGDDGLVKVWDRRSLVESTAKPVGVLAGHTDGVTFIDSRGDGRHLISNSKDQSIKLWDIRIFSGAQAAESTLKAVHQQNWDYRWQEVPSKVTNCTKKLEGDTSVMTYRGHVVRKTLIRCRFSPVETTGQRYIYTGCGLGRIFVYDALTGKVKASATKHLECVRDVHWHPIRNEIISSSVSFNLFKARFRNQT